MNSPLVSILTPTYNHERFIASCIDSVLRQTYQNWEMIIIDDGSTDSTPEILAGYDDPRIKCFNQENRGISALRTTYITALQHASGELVAILAGDDMWPAYRLEKQTIMFEDDRVVMCFGIGVMIDEQGDTISNPPIPRGNIPEVLNRPIGSILSRLLVHNFIPAYTCTISKRALDRIGGPLQPDGVLSVDSPTQLHLALDGEFRFIDKPLGWWRVHPNQHSNNFRLAQARGDNNYALEFFQNLDEETRDLTGWTEERLKQTLHDGINNAYFETGRRYLLSGDRRRAFGSFLVAIRKGSSLTKAKAVVGLVCGFTGIDLERVVRLVGRWALRQHSRNP